MNNTRRKAIRTVIKALQEPKIDWDWIESELNDVLDDETDAMESIPESLQDTDRYTTCEESVGFLEEAIDCIDEEDEDAAETIIEVLSQIDGI